MAVELLLFLLFLACEVGEIIAANVVGAERAITKSLLSAYTRWYVCMYVVLARNYCVKVKAVVNIQKSAKILADL